jgi:hypothetical protein
VPWSTTLVAVGFSPLVVNTSVSDERYATPDAERIAPPVAAELSQPWPDPAGGFAHGQGITPSTPGSHRLVKLVASLSRTKMSCTKFVSPGTRFGTWLSNATSRPAASIEGRCSRRDPVPVQSTLARSVVAAATSCTYAS